VFKFIEIQPIANHSHFLSKAMATPELIRCVRKRVTIKILMGISRKKGIREVGKVSRNKKEVILAAILANF